MSLLPTLIHADGVILGDGASLRDGAVVLSSDGEVIDVGESASVVPRHAGAKVERVRGVVFPGLVNAHTHVEVSALRGSVPGGRGFIAWLDGFVGRRSEVDAEEDQTAIERAAEALDAFVTSAVGDVSNRLIAVHALARRGIGGSVFHEVFGSALEPLRSAVAALPHMLDETVGNWPTRDLAYAVAPHALYTTHGSVVRDLVAAARDRGLPTSLHLAEHAPERRALETEDGPLVDWLVARARIPRAALTWPRLGPIAFADSLGALGPHVLSVHVTDARPEEIVLLAERAASVVLCPRSNLHIEVRLPPFLPLRAAGVEAALGTDSLASNASLDVLAEARALQDRFGATVSAREFVQMATWNGARALGRRDLGRIARGTRPGVGAVDGELGTEDPSAFLLRNVKSPRRWISRRRLEA